jgi:hypothetical protein
VSERYDSLCELFEELRRYLDRLNVRITQPGTLGPASRKIAVDILAHLLLILALARKLLKSKRRQLGRLGEHYLLIYRDGPLPYALGVHYGQSLLGNRDMQRALGRFRALAEQDLQAIVAEIHPKVIAVAHAAISAGESATLVHYDVPF